MALSPAGLIATTGRRPRRWLSLGIAITVALAGALLTGLGNAQAANLPSACSLLSAAAAERSLGIQVVKSFGNDTKSVSMCTYERPGAPAVQTVLSLILVPQNANLTRAKKLLDAHINDRVDGLQAYWYLTPSRFLGGAQSGSLSVLNHGELVWIAVRGVAQPQKTAEFAMTQVLNRIRRARRGQTDS